MVFNAWTDPEQLTKWFAPFGTYITYKQLDIKPGGFYHSCIHDPVHGECWCKGQFLEIVFPEKLVYSIRMTNEPGNDVSSQEAGKDENWPEQTIVTVMFRERNGKTYLTLHQTVAATLATKSGALAGWISMLDRLSLSIN